MSFTDAFLSAAEKFFVTAGRGPRSEFWNFALFCLAGAAGLGAIDMIIFGTTLGLPPMCLIFSLVVAVPMATLAFRRLHDLCHSGWWMLLSFVPVLGWLVLLYFFVQPGTDGDNAFGPDPLEGAALAGDFAISPAE